MVFPTRLSPRWLICITLLFCASAKASGVPWHKDSYLDPFGTNQQLPPVTGLPNSRVLVKEKDRPSIFKKKKVSKESPYKAAWKHEIKAFLQTGVRAGRLVALAPAISFLIKNSPSMDPLFFGILLLLVHQVDNSVAKLIPRQFAATTTASLLAWSFLIFFVWRYCILHLFNQLRR
ncbi:expressed unknown protein [Seminavis robusta]|uniref:Uncharacterized protein n=1 Tax=Seminavis robusta TaxID=568900 RepID=A0A9N8DV19_9STRA|nr:expressed unknown protein [Seminavis robusta]|eukprot:Sro297_g110921.1  (176) ;mRNA; f:45067-45594